jgi:hypothetical protein
MQTPTETSRAREELVRPLIEHLGLLVEDVRKIMDEGAAAQMIGEYQGLMRDALSKVRDFSKKAPESLRRHPKQSAQEEEPRAEGAQPEEQRGPEEAREASPGAPKPEEQAKEEAREASPGEPKPEEQAKEEAREAGPGEPKPEEQAKEEAREASQGEKPEEQPMQARGRETTPGEAKPGEHEQPEEAREAKPEEPKKQAEAHVEPGLRDELREVLGALTTVLDEIRGVVESLSHGLEQGEEPRKGGGLRGAIDRARRFVQKRASREQKEPKRQAEPEGARPQEERPGRLAIFDGAEKSLEGWRLVGSGSIEYHDGQLHLDAGPERGLVYYSAKRFDDFRLNTRFKLNPPDAQVFLALRFLDPQQPVPDRENPEISYPYDNPAYVASHTGFEVQLGGRRPAIEPGTFEGVLLGEAPGAQVNPERAEVNPDDWNDLAIEVQGNCYEVRLNGKTTCRFENIDAYRGKPAAAAASAGYLGLEMRSGGAFFDRIEAEEIGAEESQAGREEESRPPSPEEAPGPQETGAGN